MISSPEMLRKALLFVGLAFSVSTGWTLSVQEAQEYRALRVRYEELLGRGDEVRGDEWLPLAERTQRFRKDLSDRGSFDDADFLTALCHLHAGRGGKKGYLDKAAASFRAIARKGGETELAGSAQLVLGSIYDEQRRPKKAAAAYLEVLRRHPSGDLAEKALDRLESLGRREDSVRPGIAKESRRIAAKSKDKWLAAKVRLGLGAGKGAKDAPMLESSMRGERKDGSQSKKTAAALEDVKIWSARRATRFVLTMSKEVKHTERRLDKPDRLELEFENARVAALIKSLKIDDGLAKRIEVKEAGNSARVAIELDKIDEYSVFALHEPFRIIVDLEGRKKVRPVVRPGKPPKKPGPESGAKPAGEAALAPPLKHKVRTIVIDAGHGGHDPGALGPGGLKEKDINLAVALQLERMLRRDPTYQVYLTRRGDYFVPLEQRAFFANQRGADLFISIHCNASRNRAPTWGGIETYYLGPGQGRGARFVASLENGSQVRDLEGLTAIARRYKGAAKAKWSRIFSELIQESLTARVGLLDRGVKTAPFAVLVGTQMPAVLVEVGFLTNKNEAARLARAETQRSLAAGLYDSVRRFSTQELFALAE